MASLITGSAISVSAPVMRQIKATNGISGLNSVSFFGQKSWSFPSSLRLSISCHARRDDIFGEVRRIVHEQLGADESEIVADASFIEDLGADSLDTVELVMALEEHFEIEIDDESAGSISTVGQAVDMIKKMTKNYR